MSDLQPYGREDALWQYLNQIEQDLFAGLGSLFGPFRSEFSDEGDRYLLKIALPGRKVYGEGLFVADDLGGNRPDNIVGDLGYFL